MGAGKLCVHWTRGSRGPRLHTRGWKCYPRRQHRWARNEIRCNAQHWGVSGSLSDVWWPSARSGSMEGSGSLIAGSTDGVSDKMLVQEYLVWWMCESTYGSGHDDMWLQRISKSRSVNGSGPDFKSTAKHVGNIICIPEEGPGWDAYLPPGFQHKKLTLLGMQCSIDLKSTRKGSLSPSSHLWGHKRSKRFSKSSEPVEETIQDLFVMRELVSGLYFWCRAAERSLRMLKWGEMG